MIEIVTKGWIEVWRGDVFVSRHTVETKAIESALAHADEAGDGEYELRFPRKTLSRITKTVVPFIWQTQPALSFTQGVTKTVQLRGNYLFDPQQRVRTVVVASGSLPAGCAINGTSVVYDGVGAAATASFTLTASDGTYSQTSSSGSAEIVAVATNSPPVWTVPEGYTLPPFTTAGGTYDLSQHAFDAEGDAMVFARTAGTAPGSVTVSADGVLTVPAGLSADSYDVVIDLASNTAEADWAARSTAAGVQWAHNFTDSATEVEPYRGNGAPAQDVLNTLQHVPNGGVNGFGGAIRLNRFSTKPAPYQYHIWMRPFDTTGFTTWQGGAGTWTKGMYGPPENQAAFPAYQWSGLDEYYLQFRMRINSTWTDAVDDLNKILYLTSTPGAQTRSNMLIDLHRQRAIGAYTNTGGVYPDGSAGGLQSPQFGAAGSGTVFQTESPWNGTCYYPYINDPLRCFTFDTSKWYTIYLRIKLGSQASGGSPSWKTTSNGVVEIAYAEPGQTSYTYLFRKSDWQWIYDYPGDTPNALNYGHNRLLFTSFPQNYYGNGVPWYTEFAQVIFSHNPIACPQA